MKAEEVIIKDKCLGRTHSSSENGREKGENRGESRGEERMKGGGDG